MGVALATRAAGVETIHERYRWFRPFVNRLDPVAPAGLQRRPAHRIDPHGFMFDTVC
jgi:hypothetical protein